jgi:hypothetical protein
VYSSCGGGGLRRDVLYRRHPLNFQYPVRAKLLVFLTSLLSYRRLLLGNNPTTGYSSGTLLSFKSLLGTTLPLGTAVDQNIKALLVAIKSKEQSFYWPLPNSSPSPSLKGTHARDFHSLFLDFFCIFRSLIDTKRSTANIFEKIFFKFAQIFGLSITPHFRRKREAWLCVVAENAELNLALSS